MTLNGGATSKPNVIFILMDDLGWKDLGCYGITYYETPYLDRLATEGVRFTDAYAACPVCSPTRASILTGFLRDGASRVVVLLQVNGVRTRDHQPQPATLRHLTREELEGVKHVYYVLEENSGLLENSDASVSEKVHFVAPLDNLLWNRKMIYEIFDFKIEIYFKRYYIWILYLEVSRDILKSTNLN